MKRIQVKCKSGHMGWRSSLHENYDNDRESWLSCSETYGLADRLGYDSAEEAWDDNPIIEGSVIPSDFRVVPTEEQRKMYALASNQGTAAQETAICENCMGIEKYAQLSRQAAEASNDVNPELPFKDCSNNEALSCQHCGYEN